MPTPPSDSSPALPDDETALVDLGRSLRAAGYRFTTVTPETQRRVNARPENAAAKNLRDIFGWSRRFDPRVAPGPVLDLMRRANVLAAAGDGWLRSRVRFSTLGDLLFVHSAFPTTDADAVFFGPDTVRFVRAIERLMTTRSGAVTRAADVGCGAGAAGIAIAAAAPGAQVSLFDINAAALKASRVNCALNGVANAHAAHSDVLAAARGAFDLIVANPPYLLDAGERVYRHGGGALGEGLSLRIVREAPPLLAPGGALLLYTGSAIVEGRDCFRAAAEQIVPPTGFEWTYEELDPDVFGEELTEPAYAAAERIAAVVLTIFREPRHAFWRAIDAPRSARS